MMASPDARSEQVLMRLARDGDRDAFAKIVRKYRADALQIALGYLGNGDDARDIVQEAFLRALSHIHRFDVTRPFFPWFYRILRNLSFNFLAKKGRHGECPLVCESDGGIDPRGGDPDPFQDLLSAERAEALWRAMTALTEEHREIITLRHFKDCSYSEIATLLDIPRGTVMSRLYYARMAMKRELDRTLGVESDTLLDNRESD